MCKKIVVANIFLYFKLFIRFTKISCLVGAATFANLSLTTTAHTTVLLLANESTVSTKSLPTTHTTEPTLPPSPQTTKGSTGIPSVTTSDPMTTTTGVPHHNRQFDGPSFIGGIVLATGLMAIGFVAFKFYKARTERNYHTL
ncbi:hypothetical protein RI129_001281 [Pyrocoelia pectoralis]|uniref:Sialomucin core protein 24 n=1 Tax=Pyrocoelia pectoralis TaxID=417401 RepID=A0AAN7ZSN8_9COLE